MNIKNHLVTISLLLLFLNGFSKTHINGIYLSLSDYNNQKLTYASECSADKESIRFNDFFNKPYITVVYYGKKYTHKKNDLFGYRDCEEHDYRFYKNSEYEIAENGKIIIYAKEEDVPNSKGFTVAHLYYFSTSLGGKIMALTVENLKIAYPDNKKFQDMLDQYFIDNRKIWEFDGANKMYKVNYLLEINNQH